MAHARATPRSEEPSLPRVAATPDPTDLLSQFNLAFSLMSVIPLLICCYLITVKFFSIEILAGMNGIYFLLAILFALLGLWRGRQVLRDVIQQLVEANRQLALAHDRQVAFVHNVAHEVRTPLAIVKGALDNLADGLHGVLTSDQVEPVAMSRKEIDRLKRLVGDLLDVARIEAGKIRLVEAEVALQEVLQSVACLLGPQLHTRGLSLDMDLPEQPATLIGDADRLKQVFLNLFANAAKFTKRGGIRVRLFQAGDAFQVEVIDTGPGIPEDDLERIFDKFERVGSQDEEGSGLGLPIARDIVELHQGRLWVESQVGQGSRFIVRLPMVPPPAFGPKSRPGSTPLV